jgi:hypothetical protein
METRKITVVSTRDQKRSTIMSAATTLGELKADLNNAGINYSDMTFYEGLTKTELINDESLLPTNVSYKGQITNELVFMLTNMNKKIKSGTMTRAGAYQYIKDNNLQFEVLKRYGKNYTVCKTSELLDLIAELDKSAVEEVTSEEPKVCKCNSNLKDAFEKLISYLYVEGVLYSDQVEDIRNTLNEGVTEKVESSYSNSEIDEMFKFV